MSAPNTKLPIVAWMDPYRISPEAAFGHFNYKGLNVPLVRADAAQAEIDALQAENAKLIEAIAALLRAADESTIRAAMASKSKEGK